MQKIHELIKKLCPNGVEYKNIQELCKISRGKVMSKDFIKSNAGEYPVYSSQTENNGELGKISTYDFDGEYLTWTTDGANAGSVFYRKGKFSVTNVCGLLEIKSKVMITKFLYYVLSIEAPKYVNAGMGNPKLMSNVMAKIRVAVPPLEVQCEIVHILDDFTLLSAELSAELKARQKQFTYYEEKLLFNNNFEKVKLADLCIVNQGLQIPINQRKKEPAENRYFYITVQFLKGGDEKYYIENPQPNVICKKEDILVTRTGSTGKIITGVEGCFHNNFFKVEPNERILKRYLYFVLNSKRMYNKMLRAASGGTVPDLPHRKFYNLEIFLPSIEEQEKIINILDSFEKLCNDISEGLPAEIEARQKQYEYYRDKLLTFKELKVNE